MAHAVFDPFEALGLPRDASCATIKSQYHDLARKYHPNRHQGSDESKKALAEHFHHIYEAWKLLRNEENRKRRVQLLNLLELQDDMLTHFTDLPDTDPHPESPGSDSALSPGSDQDHHSSSDGDEDLPSMGTNRRQTISKQKRVKSPSISWSVTASNGSTQSSSVGESSIPPESTPRPRPRSADSSTRRRRKLDKLRREEVDAFFDYRNAMVAKFLAEEEAEKQLEVYELAKWRRQYFERAPKDTADRLRSMRQLFGAVRAFGSLKPIKRNHSSLSAVFNAGADNQFLAPGTKMTQRTTSRRKGWSNDISGDQTSSEDDSAGSPHSPRMFVPSQWNFSPARATAPSYRSQHDSYSARSSEHIMPTGEPQGPFRLIVKRPTERSNGSQGPGSSGDDRSGSSRSPSPSIPPPRDTDTDTNFTLLPSVGIVDIFDGARGRQPRSASPQGHRRTQSLRSSDHDAHNDSTELCHFAARLPQGPSFHHIPMDHVHLLTQKEKAATLGAEADFDSDPAVLLQRLSSLDSDVAAKFMVKPDITATFNFRLIYNHRLVAKQRTPSFIALSYRRKLHVEKHGHHFTLPLEPDMFQAFWNERLSNEEGVWIDQICIDQDSDREKTVSMSAMDMVYRSARLIVVALDDIVLDAHEAEILQNHMDEYARMIHVAPRQRFRRKNIPWLESHNDLYVVIRKMLRSSWFRRAWCRHEMRLAKAHIFLIPCKNPGSWSGHDVLRLNGKCIAHLLALSTEVPFENDVESVKPALHAFFRDRSRTASGDTPMSLHHGNFTTVVAEVFDMEAGGDPRIPAEKRASDARKDQMAIVLNTMECGLALCDAVRDPRVIFSLNGCYHDLLLLALAAQDPGALCSLGGPLALVRPGGETPDAINTWMYTPTISDSGLDNSKTLPHMPAEAQFETGSIGNCQYIQLDMKFLQDGHAVFPSEDPEMLGLARHFIQVCEEQKYGRNRKRYLLRDRKANLLFGSMGDVYVETLACVFHCGPEWMKNVCQRYSMSRWRVDAQGAFELLIALRNTHGKWPSDAWGASAAGFILDFVHFLVIRGMPQRQLTKPAKWRPIWTWMDGGGKVLTFIPMVHRDTRAATPTVLSHPEYVHLARLWMLEPRALTDPRAGPAEWTLLGKSVLFLDQLAIEQMNRQFALIREQQRVFGRPL